MAKKETAKRKFIQLSEGELNYAMSRAVVQGDWCFVSGTMGYDYNKQELPESAAQQTMNTFTNIRQALDAAGFELGHTIRVQYTVTRMTGKEKQMLKINNLSATVDDGNKTILEGLSLEVPAGEVHAIMGPNGAGKSTLSYVLTGRDGYEVTSGDVTLGGEDLLEMDPEERAAKGLFLSFQYPLEIPGVPTMTFLRTAMNAQRKVRGEDEMSAVDFLKKSKAVAAALKMKPEMLKRPLNVGFSGGEKKRMEIFQMMMLEPSFIVMDETDSGLDVDALRIVADGVNFPLPRSRILICQKASMLPKSTAMICIRIHPWQI